MTKMFINKKRKKQFISIEVTEYIVKDPIKIIVPSENRMIEFRKLKTIQ